MKYRNLARIIRAFLLLGIFFSALNCFLDLGSYFFNTKRYFVLSRGAGIGDDGPKGTYLPIGISLSIPDTITRFIGGYEKHSKGDMFKWDRKRVPDSLIKGKLVNSLVVYGQENTIEASNNLRIIGYAMLKFNSKNKIHNAFWIFYEVFDTLFVILFLVFLIKLINIYRDGDFLKVRSFKLISYLGIVLIGREVFELICCAVNGKIIPNVHLETKALIGTFSDGGIDLHFNMGNSISFSNIGLGILIVILSKIIKDAVLIKQENDLTI